MLSNTLPSMNDWVLLLEAYEALDPDDEQSAVVLGGPQKWEITFKKLLSTHALNVAPSFETDFRPDYESCEIYKLQSRQISDVQIKIEIKSDYINGHFMCESVQVRQLSEQE